MTAWIRTKELDVTDYVSTTSSPVVLSSPPPDSQIETPDNRWLTRRKEYLTNAVLVLDSLIGM